jgi:hypothetical protein
MKKLKPLNKKSYGSIPHLSGSRLGSKDHKCHFGQERIATSKIRDKYDKVIILEKLDGSNVGVALKNNQIFAITRAGYLATTSKYYQHQVFAVWVKQNESRFREVLKEGEWICAEWLFAAHGTKYNLIHEPFVVFDIKYKGLKNNIVYRKTWEEVVNQLKNKFITPKVLGYGPTDIKTAENLLGVYGHHNAIEPAEGCVWRIERKGIVDFLVKYVRKGKVDGKYLDKNIYNYNIKNLLKGDINT